ncbi:MAG: hypothetical protein MUD12_11350 [Spirochaetes bacterium]|nr:hypothetical protein [Spirochaetota bacterium]
MEIEGATSKYISSHSITTALIAPERRAGKDHVSVEPVEQMAGHARVQASVAASFGKERAC